MFDIKTIIKTIIFFLLIGGVETGDCEQWYLNYPTKFDCEENNLETKSVTSTTKSTTTSTVSLATLIPTMATDFESTVSPMTLPPPMDFPTTTEDVLTTLTITTTITTTTNSSSSARRLPWWLSLWAIVSYVISAVFVLVGFGVTIILKIRRRRIRVLRPNQNAEQIVLEMEERRQLIDDSDEDEDELFNSENTPRNNRENEIINHVDSDDTLVPPPSESENVSFVSEQSNSVTSKTSSSADSTSSTVTIQSNPEITQPVQLQAPPSASLPSPKQPELQSSSTNLPSPVRPVLPTPNISTVQGPPTSTPNRSAILRSVEETEQAPTQSPLNRLVNRVRNEVRKRRRRRSEESISDSAKATRIQPKREAKKNINYKM